MRNWYRSSRSRMIRRLLQVICVIVLAGSLFMLGRYILQAVSVKQQQQSMSEEYHSAASATEQAIPSPSLTPEKTVALAAASAAPVPTSTVKADADALPAVVYPSNPNAIYSVAFSTIREKNSDIMAWLQVNELVDSAVVLRNNEYYLTHDTSKKQNTNGALFLDESTTFYRNQRPYTFIVYGHNMKTGAMFGSLKEFEKRTWYYSHPFITFNTLYEDGDYVIFSVATVNVESIVSPAYVDYYDLYSTSRSERMECISKLRNLSSYYNRVPLSGDDQVLLLVTCNGNDDERLIIAARRIRDGESRESLQKLVP